MEFCFLAKIVLLLSVIAISLDMYAFGFSIISFSVNVIFTLLFVAITNWACYKENYTWISWVIVMLSFIMLSTSIYIYKNQNNEYVKQFIEEEKKYR